MDSLESQRVSFREQLSATVADVNTTAASVAEYNRAIVAAVQGGGSPNDLKDQRDLLVQRLGEMTGGTVRQGQNGSVDVYVGTTKLVDGAHRRVARGVARLHPHERPVGDRGRARHRRRSCSGPARGHQHGPAPLHRRPAGRHAEAQRRGQHPARGRLDPHGCGRHAAVRHQRRAHHRAPRQARADRGERDARPDGDPDAGGGNASALAALAGKPGGPDVTYRGLVVQLGVESQTAIRRTSIQSGILAQVDSAREAQSGVNLDEEMTNMLAFQRGYEGAARFITAVDQMLDTLINRTGLVGR
jgi:flagellar hook-associated protein 1 FlgK